MKEFSKEIINIDGKDYTLFLNRKGLITWEKLTHCSSKIQEIENKYQNIKQKSIEEDIEIKEGDNPFEIVNEIETEFEKDNDILMVMYQKLYWIMLYDTHKLDFKEVCELWNKACEEYGEEQLIDLAVQMIEDANTNKSENLKKLAALKPKKNN